MTHGKDQGYPTADRFRPIKTSFGANKQILFALCRLPREDGRAEKEDLDRLAGRQACSHSGVVVGDGDLRGRYGGRDGDGGRFLGSLHVVGRVEVRFTAGM